MSDIRLICGDCLDGLRDLPDGSVDAVVTDPPYGVGVAAWDGEIPPQEVLTECLRVLERGGSGKWRERRWR